MEILSFLPLDSLESIAVSVLAFLVILTVLVFVHELGHFWVARRCGVKCEAFSIGFGPELFGWNDSKGTRWKFSALPLGGYVKMFGDADVTSRPAPAIQEAVEEATGGEEVAEGEETGDWAGGKARPLTAEERAVSFHHKSLSRRVAIVAAGPAANFLFAIVVMTAFFVYPGQPTTPALIGGVVEDSAAAEAGLQAGDRVLEINGSRIERFEQIQRLVHLNLEAPLAMLVERDGRPVELTATPQIVVREDAMGNEVPVPMLGIQASGSAFVPQGLSAPWAAVEETVSLTGATLQAVWQMITGTRGTDELGGPIRIAEMSGQVAQTGVISVVWFMAVLSINLGLINLFPVPMLDGGHLLFYAIEGARGRPLGERAQEYGFRIGLAMVLTLFVFVTWNDLSRLLV
ncbi:MAG: RIP metalloprotease RseP, partial [Tistlia sp.]